MNPSVTDHPVKAAVFRSTNGNPNMRSFVFEELPVEVRRRIFRALLLKPRKHLSQDPDTGFTLYNSLYGDQMIEIGGRHYHMHTKIMCTNKRLHNEAAAVLYGENWYVWSLYTICPRHYSRLITKMRLVIEVYDIPSSAYWIGESVRRVCKTLSLNDFKVLVVDYQDYHEYNIRQQSRTRCLEPLSKCRAQKVSIKSAYECSAVLKLTRNEVPFGQRFHTF